MTKKYPNLLSPIRLGNHILKNRMTTSPSSPHFVQGREPYPTDAFITNLANRAKNGSALVTCSCVSDMPEPIRNAPGGKRQMAGRFTLFDVYDPQSQEYLSQLTEAIHFYGSLASMEILPPETQLVGYDMSSGIPSLNVEGDGMEMGTVGTEIPEEKLEEVVEYMARQSQLLQDCGFDGVFVHMSYKASLLGRSLSRVTNKRADKFGGSLENRCRFPFMVCDRIKELCGKDFIIEASVTGYDPLPDGWTLEEMTQFMKLAEGHIDIVQLRANEIDPAHPTGYNPEKRPFVYMAEAAKKANSSVLTATIGGYLDPDASEEIIASGKADLIAMARPWISNPEYGKLVYEGRGEDIVPCIRCNKCHRSSYADPWTSVCSVNPVWGLEHKIDRMITQPECPKSIAVVGGGPGGMKAAIILAERGHRVTLFEKGPSLGGMLDILAPCSFKWPVTDFKNYLIRQLEKSNVKVLLNTEATPELIRQGEYDAAVVAVGAEPVIPPIEGIGGANVITAVDAFSDVSKVKGDAVVIGGGEIGVEAGMYLCDSGHKALVLEMEDMLAKDSTPIHFYSMFKTAWQQREGFSARTGAKVTKIDAGGVTYVDKDGKEQYAKADTVVVAAGMKPSVGKAFEFAGADYRVYYVGDCVKAGNIQKTMRSAFSTASII